MSARRVLLGILLVLPGCGWAGLAIDAFRYPTTARDETSNVVVAGDRAYAARAERGIAVIDVATGATVAEIPPPPRTDRVDDLAAADGFLFALDASGDGNLTMLSLVRGPTPVVVSGPIHVPVGPFSGVAAANGRAIVSGGTSELTVFAYDAADGSLTGPLATLDLGRGQPDVALSPDGALAVVSTHFEGPRFGITAVNLADAARPTVLGSLELDGAGFTAGGAHPANFPIVAAFAGDTIVVAHGAGLAIVALDAAGAPRLAEVIPLPVAAVHVAAADTRIVVVGSSPRPRLVELVRDDAGRFAVTRESDLPADSFPTAVALGPRSDLVAGGPTVLRSSR